MSPADEVLTLDPGNRLPVGTVVEPRYKPAAGEVFTGWSGACIGKEACQFIVNQVINLEANVKQLPVKFHEVAVLAKGLVVSGLGKTCFNACKITKPAGANLRISAKDNKAETPNLKVTGWLGCNLVKNMVCYINNLSRNRKVTAKTAVVR